jgi:hypothetical protein
VKTVSAILIPFIVLSLNIRLSGQAINPLIKESCAIVTQGYFSPDCFIDTCKFGASMGMYITCEIDSMHVTVYDTAGTKLIFHSDHFWDAKQPDKQCYYPSGFYPYEITVFAKDGSIIKKAGKIKLEIWYPENVCQ